MKIWEWPGVEANATIESVNVSPTPRAGAVLRDVLFAKKGTGDETVYDFFTRRMSNEVSLRLTCVPW